MNDRPKIKLSLTPTDKIVEGIGWLAICGIWILALGNYADLPEIIPIHFNGFGEADRFGAKPNILILPIISTLIYIGMTVLNKYPHIFNYPTSITEKNALSQYTSATKMIRFLKLIMVLILGFIVFETIQIVNGKSDGLGVWFLPIILGMIFIPIGYYLIKAKSTNKNKTLRTTE